MLQTLVGLGLMPGSSVAGPIKVLSPKKQNKVLILGAGLSGMIAAYELTKAGYDCTILEASHRIGGRNFTVRHGDMIDEIGNRQICEFDDDPTLYFNAGPARIPAHHQRILGYCRELGVKLEPFINMNSQGWVQDDKMLDGKPVRIREYVADARGFLSEMLSKSITPAQLEQPLSGDDQERLLAFVRKFGDLDINNLYKGSSRSNYATDGIMTYGTKKGVLDFSELLKSDFWELGMNWAEGETQTAPVMQMVGGNDKIIQALTEKVGHLVTTKAQVSAIKLKDRGVSVVYSKGGKEYQIETDFCLNSIPSRILAGIENNFPANYVDALSQQQRGHLFKIAFQAKTRFWEKENIYGGISWSSEDIQQIWYPANDFHNDKGVILGAYIFKSAAAMKFTNMRHQERISEAIRQGEKIHANYSKQVEAGVSVAWHKMNHILGCSSHVQDFSKDAIFQTIRKPVGRHFLCGDQITHHTGWQEGAVGAAHYVINQMNEVVNSEI